MANIRTAHLRSRCIHPASFGGYPSLASSLGEGWLANHSSWRTSGQPTFARAAFTRRASVGILRWRVPWAKDGLPTIAHGEHPDSPPSLALHSPGELRWVSFAGEFPGR